MEATLKAKDGTTAKDITNEFILNYCKNAGPDAIAWLKNEIETEVEALKYPLGDEPAEKSHRRKQDKTKEPIKVMRHYTFFEIKKHFIEKYYPELIKEKKPKKKSFFDLVREL